MNTTTETDKKKEIQILWQKLPNDGSKTAFIKLCANKFGKSVKTVRQWWFSNYGDWCVPTDHQDEVISLLQEKINISR